MNQRFWDCGPKTLTRLLRARAMPPDTPWRSVWFTTFVDWRCWAIGVELQPSPGRDDRLGQCVTLVFSLGPAVAVVRWPRR